MERGVFDLATRCALASFCAPALGSLAVPQLRPQAVQGLLAGCAYLLAHELVRVAREVVVFRFARRVTVVGIEAAYYCPVSRFEIPFPSRNERTLTDRRGAEHPLGGHLS
jgi:hypothetical protein